MAYCVGKPGASGCGRYRGVENDRYVRAGVTHEPTPEPNRQEPLRWQAQHLRNVQSVDPARWRQGGCGGSHATLLPQKMKTMAVETKTSDIGPPPYFSAVLTVARRPAASCSSGVCSAEEACGAARCSGAQREPAVCARACAGACSCVCGRSSACASVCVAVCSCV